MRRNFLPATRTLKLGFSILLLLAACTSPPPTPVSSPAPVLATRTAGPKVSNTPAATIKPRLADTPTTTITPTPSVDSSQAPAAFATAPPAPLNAGKSGPIDKNLWFMSQLIAYFSQVGPYPPEPPIARPAGVNPLTGLSVPDPALLQRRVILARLMNDPSARPQTGLNEADLVFEELIDQRNGVIALTRLTAVYLGIPDATIRPMRSVRLVNPSLADMFDGALVHSGASNGMNFLLSKIPVTSIGEDFHHLAFCAIGIPGKTLTWATTTVQHLHDYLKTKGKERPAILRGFEFSPDPPEGPERPATTVGFDHLPFPVTTVGTVVWKYDPTSGDYLRFANGNPHNTLQYQVSGRWGGACQEATQPVITQVHAANVVLINAPHHPADPNDFTEDSNKFSNIFIELTGSGPATVFRDGIQIASTWQRPTLQHFFKFVSADGEVVLLKPGNTWFEIVPPGYVPTVR